MRNLLNGPLSPYRDKAGEKRIIAGWAKQGITIEDYDPRYNGVFRFPLQVAKNHWMIMIASQGEGWEHVSVRSTFGGVDRIPSWNEMNLAKQLCFEDTDVCMQLHPAKSDYVNINPYVLHIWRPLPPLMIPTPPMDHV